MGKSYGGTFFVENDRYILTVLTDYFAQKLVNVSEGATMVLYKSPVTRVNHKRAFAGCPGSRKWINLRVYIDQSFRSRFQYLGWNDAAFASNLANHMNVIYGNDFNINFWIGNVESHAALDTRDGGQLLGYWSGYVRYAVFTIIWCELFSRIFGVS
jgi:hypothetical protein